MSYRFTPPPDKVDASDRAKKVITDWKNHPEPDELQLDMRDKSVANVEKTFQ
jgi:hypothetical protein